MKQIQADIRIVRDINTIEGSKQERTLRLNSWIHFSLKEVEMIREKMTIELMDKGRSSELWQLDMKLL